MSRVDIQHVTKRYGSFAALDNVSITFNDGEFFGLLGPSGSGKTTLLRSIAGFITPDEGTISFDGERVESVPVHRRAIGMVFQSYALFPHLTIRDNVSFGPKRRKDKDAARRTEDALELVQMSSFAGRKPAQLSGGQQQRVALARALVNHPEVLLLDEPLGALDLKLRREMQVELKRIQTEVGLTFIHVTHDQEEAMTMADTVAVMNKGHIEQLGGPAELYDLPRTRFVANFLGQANTGVGTIKDTDGDHLVADVLGTPVKILKSRSQVHEGKVLFGVRPEKVTVSRTRPEGVGNDVLGIVRDVSFLGVATSYLVDMPSGTTWSCYEQNLDVEPLDLRPGDEVWLTWNSGHAFGVPADES